MYVRSCLALSGIHLFADMEDTYEVEGEELFGFLRGGYSIADLKDLDRHASAVCLELIPWYNLPVVFARLPNPALLKCTNVWACGADPSMASLC